MFGQAGNPSFGFTAATQNSPFGQSTFGKTIATNTFGTSAPPVFGSNTSLFSSKPSSSAAGSLFGNTTTNSSFGVNTVSQSTFGGFGNTSSSNPIFAPQQNSNANIFGTNSTTVAFGQSNKQGTFGFSSSTGNNLFGQPQQNTSQVAPFGQSNTTGNTGLFGAATGFCTNSSGNMSGTVIKFSPVTGTDTMVKNGVTQTISTRHHCITCMKEYESKSLEELRLEDYNAGRKGVNQVQSSAIFGNVTQNSPFGSVVPSNNSANSSFGTVSTGFSNPNQSNNSNVFSKPVSGFGAPATTTTAFAFNSTGSSNIFNAQSKPFGSTSSTPLFSSNNVGSSVASTFGNIHTHNNAFGASFNSAQPNQSIGLFSQNKPAFSMPTSSSSSTFGFGQSSTTNAGNLFGSKTIANSFGSTFGGSNVPAFTAGNSVFGSGQNTNSTLFNNTFKSTGQPTTFTFGNIPTISSTGIGSSGSSLFTPSTKPNLFGSSGNVSTFNTSGTFGSVPGFGSAVNTISTFGSNVFGSGSYASNIEQGSSTVPVHQQILALVSTPFGDSPLLKNLLPASGKSEEFLKPSNSLCKNVNNLPYKILSGSKAMKLKPKVIAGAPIFKKSLFDGLEEEDPLLEAFQPRSNARRLVLRPKSQEYSCNLLEINNKIPNCEKSTTPVIEIIPDISYKENDILYSWLKISIPQKSKCSDDQFIEDPLFPASASSEILSTTDEIDNTVVELRSSLTSGSKFNLKNNITIKDITDISISNNKNNLDNSSSESVMCGISEDPCTGQQIHSENRANIILERYGYYTIPSISMLDKYVVDKTCIVPNFTVGRKGYGNVYFSDCFDIYGLNLDEIVHFRHKEVIVYPNDNSKPPVGQGLNRKAQVTLDRVWPEDKLSHDFITDPKRLIEMDYESKLRRVCAKHDTRFLEYRPETGSWVFKVDHFSKYGLYDSDDDDNEINNSEELKKDQICGSFERSKSLVCLGDSIENIVSPVDASFTNVFDSSVDDSICKRQHAYSSSALHARLVGTKTHTLQLMKATFFESTYNNLTQESIKNYKQNLNNKHHRSVLNNNQIYKYKERAKERTSYQTTNYDDSYSECNSIVFNIETSAKLEQLKSAANETTMKTVLKLTDMYPKVAVLHFKPGCIFFNELMINKKRSMYIADMGIQMGKIFRPTWGPRLTLLSLCTQSPMINNCLKSTSDGSEFGIADHSLKYITSACTVQRLQILGNVILKNNVKETYKISLEGHLTIQLQHSEIAILQDFPIVKTPNNESSISALNSHKMHSANVAYNGDSDALRYLSNVWKLCESLWGKLSDLPISYSKGSITHEHVMLRKEALSEWLKLVTAETVNREIASMESKHKIIFSLLSANKLNDACEIALKAGDHCLALLLSQLRGIFTIQELAKQQIELWKYTYVDGNLSTDNIKLFMIIAGVPVICISNEIVNVCENLDWKRALALHLWYFSLPTASITDVLDLYEKSFLSFERTYTVSPVPEYFKNKFFSEINTGKPVYDVCFHLIKLYCTGNYPLEAILNPQTYTYDTLDYSLSWFLQQTLSSLGYTHLSTNVSVLINNNFATQLETIGLWHWAVFVVLHFQDLQMRHKAVFELLLRNVELDNTSDYVKREKFIEIQLKIPAKWINYTKAIKASAMNRYEEAAQYFIHARAWNEAHDIIMQHLATDAIINDSYIFVKSLLQSLISTSDENTISGWTNQGQLIWDYITVTTEVKNLLRERNCLNISYYLESCQPQLTTFCAKLSLFPCPSINHRLCQAEMAKTTFQLIRSLLIVQSNEADHSNFLIYLISQLPLPEDYAQQELRPTINLCINNIDCKF